MKSKITFAFNGMEFTVPSTCLKTTSYWNEPLPNPVINIGRKEVPLMFKQYVKSKYPQLLVWGKSSTFANGNSADLYACLPNGDEIDFDSPMYSDLRSFTNSMQQGRYNGMEDMYEYGDDGSTDNGTTIDWGCKYVNFNGKAPFGTWPDVKRMLTDMMAGKYVWGVITLEEAIKKTKGYSISDSVIEKAMAEMA
jgi:hypothetical protein